MFASDVLAVFFVVFGMKIKLWKVFEILEGKYHNI